MAAAFVAERGSAQNKTAQSTTAVTLTDTVVVGRKLVVLVVSDDTNQLTSVTDSQSNTYSAASANPGSTEVEGRIWAANITTQLTTSDIVTITWATPNPAAKAILLVEVSGAGTGTPSFNALNGSSSTPSLSGLGVNRPDIVTDGIGFVTWGAEGPNTDTFTMSEADWNALTKVGTSGGGATSNVTLFGFYRTVAGTDLNADGTLSNSRDWNGNWGAWAPAIDVSLAFRRRPSGLLVPAPPEWY